MFDRLGHIPTFLLVLLITMASGFSAFGQPRTHSEEVASYDMEITLDTTNKKIAGHTVLSWTNTSSVPVHELYFHMYYNAFRNSKSTFFKERGVPAFLTTDIDEICGWGWTHIYSFEDNRGTILTDSMYYVQTDDNNSDDRTVLLVRLARPVLPGETQDFTFDWEARIPKTMPRTGYNKSFYFMAQWFPKLGVLEPAGMRFADKAQWNCHQYHSNGEYYADFGNYNVSITVPSDYTVAASGVLRETEEKGGMNTWHFHAHDVIDFTWTCSPHYVVSETAYKNTTIRYYSYPYKVHLKERYFSTIKYAMSFLESHLAPYPYETLSIIDPPIHGMFTGGMEYPTLISTLSFCFFPEGFRTPETLVVHEFIHQYFMQMVATHEVEEPWMDEGVTSYYESRILDGMLGADRSTIDFLGFRTGNKTFNRVEYLGMDHPSIASNAIKSWEYKHGGYGEIAYNKAALWLQTLEGLIGTELMDDIMRRYFELYSFRHPCRYDFIEVVDSMVINRQGDRFPDGMQWFFDQVLYGTGMCDYAVADIRNTEVQASRGFLNSLDECEVATPEGDTIRFKSVVELHRLGTVQLPQEILIRFENGEERTFQWDGLARAHSIELETAYKVVLAEIDPERKIYMDSNFINNVRQVEPQTAALNRISTQLFVRLQSLLEFVSFAI